MDFSKKNQTKQGPSLAGGLESLQVYSTPPVFAGF